jgi:hypothetical protein
METERIALRQRERDRLCVLPRFKFEKTWLFIALLKSGGVGGVQAFQPNIKINNLPY